MQLVKNAAFLRITIVAISLFILLSPNAYAAEKLFRKSDNVSFRLLEKIANAEKLKSVMKVMKKEDFDLKEIHTVENEFWYEYTGKYGFNTIGINISSYETVNAIKDAV